MDGELTEKDYELLSEALDSWEKEPLIEEQADSLSGIMVRIATGRGSDLAKTDRDVAKIKAQTAAKSRRQTIVMLRAKLEMKRQAAQTAAIDAAAGKGGG